MTTAQILTFVGAGAVVLVLLALLAFLASRLKTVAPDEALIVVGMGGGKKPEATTEIADAELGTHRESLSDSSRFTIHTNGRVFIVPVVQDYFLLSLKQRQVDLDVSGPDRNFVNVKVSGTLSYKFSDDPHAVLFAAQRFRSKTDQEIDQSVQQAVEGSLRSIVASMTYREINGDRVAFQENVLRNLKAELSDQGIVVDILNIRSAEAPGTYAEDLAAAELAEAQQVAAIARANASREAEFAQIAADTAIAERRRDLSLKQSVWKAETDREAAIADASGQISRQEQDVLVEERKREALAAQALATQEQLDISQKKPADAAAYAAAKRAEGDKQAAQHTADAELYTRTRKAEADAAAAKLAAEAQAYTTKTQAEARAEAARVTAQAEADATRARGLADAEVARQVGQAEADATTAKAEALGRYGEQSLAYEVVQRLPEIIAANADAIRGIGSYTVFGGSPTDAVNMAGQMFAQGLSMVKQTTGVDVVDAFRRTGVVGAGEEKDKGDEAVNTSPTPEQQDRPVGRG